MQSSKRRENEERCFEICKEARAMEEAARLIYLTASAFWQWHCPSVIWEDMPDEITNIMLDYFGPWAKREERELVIRGPFTEDDEGP